MKSGDQIQMRVDGREWLVATVIMVTADDRPGLVVVDEGIPAPFSVLFNKQAVAIVWTGDVPTDLFCEGRKLEFKPIL